MCRRNRSLGSVERFLDFMPGSMKLCSAGDPAREGLISNFAIGVIFIFAMTLALLIMGQSRPWSGRYLFLAFNAGATTDVETR